MSTSPCICVVVPVYNHGLTVGRVVQEASWSLPVIAVDDGSTDETPRVLDQLPSIRVVTLARNQGKAAALRAGFAKAQELGFSHVITIDADGQHPTQALTGFAAACREAPEALVIGVRDLKAANAPGARRLSNALSTFWFTFETGIHLPDTQCGYRVYPLAVVSRLDVESDRYAFELEIMVKAAWAGIPLRPQPVSVDYSAATSRLSHFHPVRDFLRAVRTHTRLAAQACYGRFVVRGGRGNNRKRLS
jgi:glycosyltransferase involved in cell wall biosynthesis